MANIHDYRDGDGVARQCVTGANAELYKIVDGTLVAKTQAEIDAENSGTILEQIATLEARQTARLLREASLGGQYALDALTKIDADIAALRSQL